MGECVCNNCRNLIGQPNEEGAVERYECEYGFPSEGCSECSGEESCEVTCSHYICDDEQDEIRLLACKGCGKELRQACSDAGDGDVYCMECYLKRM